MYSTHEAFILMVHIIYSPSGLAQEPGLWVPKQTNKKGLRQCAKLHDFGGAVVVILVVVLPGQ